MAKWIHELRPTLALALPIMLGQVSQMLMGIADSMMIGRVGTVELAAASFTGAVFNLIFIGCIGLMQPGSVLVARANGAGRPDEAGLWLRHARWMAWTAGLGLAGLMAASLLVADRFGQPAEVVAAMGPYYALIAASLVPAMLFQVDRQFSEALGRPWEPLFILLAGSALNVLLNWMFIYGRLGAPAWGLTGAGVATLVARVAVVAALRVWLAGVRAFATETAAARVARVAKARVREMLALGIPMGAALFFEGAAFSGAAVLSGWLGTVPLAAHQIAISCASLTFMVPLGLSIALTMRTGEAVGAGRLDRVRPMAVGATVLTCATAAVSTAAFVLFGEVVAGAFSRDAAVVTLAARVLVIVAVFQLFDGLQVVFAGSLRGLTDVKAPLAAAFLAYWALALPAGWWFGVRGDGGLEAIWLALAAGLAVAAVLLGWRLRVRTRM
jgi:MATE family multidrug resistance protein